jgi:hypothetical protein
MPTHVCATAVSSHHDRDGTDDVGSQEEVEELQGSGRLSSHTVTLYAMRLAALCAYQVHDRHCELEMRLRIEGGVSNGGEEADGEVQGHDVLL